MRTPEENWQRWSGVIAGPGLGLIAAIVASAFTPDDIATGAVISVAMATGLVAGVVYDLVKHRRRQ